MSAKACEDRAAFCEKLAQNTTDQKTKDHLLDIAAHWRRIGKENDSTEALLEFLDSLDVPSSKVGNGGPTEDKPPGDGQASNSRTTGAA